MHKSVKNCRSLNMQTIKLRRSRPSTTAIALALAITMLIVYILSLQSCPKEAAEASAAPPARAELRMEDMEIQFLLSGFHDDATRARVAAAQCAQGGGAGIVLREGDRYGVVYAAGRDFTGEDAPVITRRSNALRMRIEAPAAFIAAAEDALSTLRALATETQSLAGSMERGETDAGTASALLNIYRTKLRAAKDAMEGADHAAAVILRSSAQACAEYLEEAVRAPSPGLLRFVHAAACREWLNLSGNLLRLTENHASDS